MCPSRIGPLAALVLLFLLSGAAPARAQFPAELWVTKTGPATATPGEGLAYVLEVWSRTITPGAIEAQLVDIFPAGLVACQWTCTPVAGIAACGAASGAGDLVDTSVLTGIVPLTLQAVRYDITCSIGSNVTGTVTNQATVIPLDPFVDTIPDNNAASFSTQLVQVADLAITKADGSATATPGGTVTYTVDVSNPAGPSAAHGATVTDDLPAVLTGVAWTCAPRGGASCPFSGSGDLSVPVDVPVGGGVTFTVTGSIPASATGTLSNTAQVTGPVGGTDPQLGDNSATDTSALVPAADLAITKTDGRTTATPGEAVTYTIVVSNAGPSDSLGALVSDSFPATLLDVTWTCVEAGGATCASAGTAAIADTVDLPAGSSVTYTASGTLSADASGSLTNTATVAEGGTNDPSPANNLATDVDTIVRSAGLSITKADLSDPVLAGGSLLYRLTVTNAGPSRASGAEVTDLLPDGVTFASASGEATCLSALDVLTGRDRVACSFASLAAGSQAAVTITTQVAPTVSGTLVNEAVVATVQGDADPSAADDTAIESTTVLGRADLSVTIADDPDPVAAGNALTYTLTVANAGPGTATGVTLTDTLPGGVAFTSATAPAGATCGHASGVVTCSLGSVAVGSPVTVTIVVAVGDALSGTLTNVAIVSATEADPAAGNNAATAVTTVNPPTDLSVTKRDLADPVEIGDDLAYVIEVRNRGPYGATGVRLVDTLPAGVSFVSATPTQGTCVGAGGAVECSLGTMASGGLVTVNLVARVEPSAPATLTNSATVSAPITDTDASNNTATAVTTVSRTADLTLTKTASPSPVAAGSTLRYTFTVSNQGPGDAPATVLTDVLPAGTRFVSPVAPGETIFADGFESGDLSAWSDASPLTAAKVARKASGACTAAGSTVTCALGTLAAGVTAEVSIDVEVLPTASGSLTNAATVRSGVTDPTPSNASASVTVSVRRRIDVGVAIADAPDPVAAGAILVYTLTVTNAGPATATGVAVGDPLPAELTLLSAVPSQGSCTETQEVVCALGSLGPGASATVTIRAVVSAGASGALTNAAAVVANEVDLNAANDTDTETTTID